MKQKKHPLFYALISLGLILISSGCMDSKTNSQVTEQLGMTPEEAKLLTAEMLEHRKASIILSEFVTLKGNQYVLNISMEDAKKKGITEVQYKKVVKDLEDSNQAITKALQEGEKLELPLPKVMFKELREKIN